jgi:hypothetical protein
VTRHLISVLGVSTNVIVGCLVGLMAAPAGVWVYDEARSAYDRLNPVVSMSGVLVETIDQTVRIGIRGSKNRDCMYLRLVAYGIDATASQWGTTIWESGNSCRAAERSECRSMSCICAAAVRCAR